MRMLSAVVIGLFAAPAAVAADPLQEGAFRFYGSETKPCVEIQLCELASNIAGESNQPEDAPCYMSVTFLAHDRARVAVGSGRLSADSFFVQRRAKNGFVVSGRLAIEDKVHLVHAVLSSERRKLEWLAPETVTLSDGRTFRMAGRYGERSNEKRNAASKVAFEKTDAEMNEIYAAVKGTLSETAFEQVRETQHMWLKYRDRPYEADYDGDYAQNGPGSATHFRRMSGDTGARIEYLKSFLHSGIGRGFRDGHYSDGVDRTIQVRFLGDLMSFILEIRFQELHVEEHHEWHGLITGCARPEENIDHVWSIEADAISGSFQESVIPEQVKFVFLPDGTLEVNLPAADDAVGHAGTLYGGRFRRLRALKPGEDSLRHWLTLLPERAFEGTTDPLTRKDTLNLARTGSGGQGFTIAEERWDRLVMNHPDGHVVLARFARKDGGLIIAVQQTNGRNLELDFWEWDAAAESFRPWDVQLPEPGLEEFFRRPLTDAETSALEKQCRVGRSLRRESLGNSIDIGLKPATGYEGPIPDYMVNMEWDGWRLSGFMKTVTL